MSPADLVLHLYVWAADELKAAGLTHLRSRGPEPALTDAEVLAIELAGAALGFATDVAIYWHFRRHYQAEFPALRFAHRTTFVRRAANLWQAKRASHGRSISQMAAPTESWLVDSMPVPACRFGRAKFCKRYYGQADYGYDHSDRRIFYGFRLHVRSSLDGLILAAELAPARASEVGIVPELNPPPESIGIGDRGYWNPELKAQLAEIGIRLHTPYQAKSRDKDPLRSKQLAGLRYRIETTQGQPAERYAVKRLKTRNLGHLVGRLWRAILSHTLLCRLCRKAGLPALSHAKLLAA